MFKNINPPTVEISQLEQAQDRPAALANLLQRIGALSNSDRLRLRLFWQYLPPFLQLPKEERTAILSATEPS